MQRVGIWYQQSGHHCVSSSSAPSAPSASSLPVPHQGLGVAVTTWDSLNYWGRNDQSQSVLLQSARNAVCNNSAMSNNPTMANATPSYLNGTFVGKLIDYGVVDHRSSPMGPSLSNLVVPQPSTTQDLNRCLSSSSLGAMAHQAAFAVPNQAATVQASAAPHVNGLLDLLASAAAQVSEQSNQSGGRSGESSSPNAVELFPTRQHQANALPQQIGGEGIEENSPRRNQFDVETVQPAQPVRHSNPKTAEGTAEVSTDAGICSRKTNGTTVAQGVQALLPGQKIGRMRKYNEQNKSYGAWEDIIVPANGCLTLGKRRKDRQQCIAFQVDSHILPFVIFIHCTSLQNSNAGERLASARRCCHAPTSNLSPKQCAHAHSTDNILGARVSYSTILFPGRLLQTHATFNQPVPPTPPQFFTSHVFTCCFRVRRNVALATCIMELG